MSFAGYFLPVLFCMLSMLISDSRFDLVWFRLSCDHGWIRSGSVNVRKQQQQQLESELDLDLCHFDAEQAFVQSDLDEVVYISLPLVAVRYLVRWRGCAAVYKVCYKLRERGTTIWLEG